MSILYLMEMVFCLMNGNSFINSGCWFIDANYN